MSWLDVRWPAVRAGFPAGTAGLQADGTVEPGGAHGAGCAGRPGENPTHPRRHLAGQPIRASGELPGGRRPGRPQHSAKRRNAGKYHVCPRTSRRRGSRGRRLPGPLGLVDFPPRLPRAQDDIPRQTPGLDLKTLGQIATYQEAKEGSPEQDCIVGGYHCDFDWVTIDEDCADSKARSAATCSMAEF